MKVLAYYRGSTELQEKGIESQRLACREYAKNNNLEIIKEFEEKESTLYERPVFEKLLKEVVEYQGILVYDLDRLTRDPVQLGRMINIFSTHNIRIFQTIGEIDITSDDDLLIARIKTDVALYEREKIRRRIKSGIKNRKAKGLPFGRPKSEININLFKRYIRNNEFVISKESLCKIFMVSRSTLLRWMKENGFEYLIEDLPENFNKKKGEISS